VDPPPPAGQVFKRLDLDEDGQVTLAEMQGLHAQVAAPGALIWRCTTIMTAQHHYDSLWRIVVLDDDEHQYDGGVFRTTVQPPHGLPKGLHARVMLSRHNDAELS
jgi:hypothetical protein